MHAPGQPLVRQQGITIYKSDYRLFTYRSNQKYMTWL